MKKSIFILALLLSSVLYKAADAQVSVNINIGQQPVWGPVGYDYVDYYYFPDADIYYNVPRGQYVYFDGRTWVFSLSLPSRWSRFDLYNSYKVVINEPNPFYRNDYWRSRYMGYRGQRQNIIYYSREPKYYVIQNHPQHNVWIENNRRNDRGYDNRTVYNNGRGYDNRVNNNNNVRQENRIQATPERSYDNRNNRTFEQGRVSEINNNRVITQQRNNDRQVNPNLNQRSNEAGRSNDNRSNNFERRSSGRRF